MFPATWEKKKTKKRGGRHHDLPRIISGTIGPCQYAVSRLYLLLLGIHILFYYIIIIIITASPCSIIYY